MKRTRNMSDFYSYNGVEKKREIHNGENSKARTTPPRTRSQTQRELIMKNSLFEKERKFEEEEAEKANKNKEAKKIVIIMIDEEEEKEKDVGVENKEENDGGEKRNEGGKTEGEKKNDGEKNEGEKVEGENNGGCDGLWESDIGQYDYFNMLGECNCCNNPVFWETYDVPSFSFDAMANDDDWVEWLWLL